MANYDILYKVVLKGDFDTPAERFADVSFVKDPHTFYLVGNDIYVGSVKLSNGADLAAAVADIAQNAADIVTINSTLTKLENTEETSGSIRNIIKSYLDAVDVTEFALASESNGVVTIKGIKQVDSAITVGTDSNNDVVFDKVATSGAAEDLDYDNTESGLTATDVQSAIDEVAAASAGGVDSKTVWFTDNSAGQSDYAKVFKLYQGANAPDAQTNPATLVGTINIPKDKVLQDADIVTITFSDNKLYDGVTDVTTLIVGSDTPTAADAGKYLKMEMQNVTDPLYVNLQTFVDVYTVESGATEIQLGLNDHELSASVVSIDGSKIVYKAETSSGAGDGETVKQALTRLDGSNSTTGSVAKKVKDAIDALDADLDASGTAQHSGTFVVSGVTEVDGVITAVDSVEVEAAGAAAAVLGESTDTASDNTVYGAKAAAAAAQSDVDALETLVGTIPVTSQATTVVGYVDEQVAAATGGAIDDLDVTEFALAEKDSSTNVITVHGISQTDGEIAVGVAAANDVVFASVAGSGASSDVSYTNANLTGVTAVDGALDALVAKMQWQEI